MKSNPIRSPLTNSKNDYRCKQLFWDQIAIVRELLQPYEKSQNEHSYEISICLTHEHFDIRFARSRYAILECHLP